MNYSIKCDSDTFRIYVVSLECKSVSLTLDSSAKPLPVVAQSSDGAVFDAADLDVWSPEHPTLYDLRVSIDGEEEKIKFGFRSLSSCGKKITLNSKPYYFRGYIRGIVAHDHPNMTGGDKRAYYLKNIMQAKKYGFNLVRFHSTVPDEMFVELADELGLFVHLEIGFNFSFDEKGDKGEKFIDRELWVSTLEAFRNHPSVMTICIGNEMHNAGKDKAVAELYRIGKEKAPGVLILDNAGWG